MAKQKSQQPKKLAYQYDISDVEAAYKVFRNPDSKKFEEIRNRLNENDGYCPSRGNQLSENRCMCVQFRNRDSEGWCKCRLYFKEARTKKQAAAFKNSEFTVNEKKEKELEKQLAKEEKLKQKEAEALSA